MALDVEAVVRAGHLRRLEQQGAAAAAIASQGKAVGAGRDHAAIVEVRAGAAAVVARFSDVSPRVPERLP